jgi:hypothetical protein
MVLMKQSLLRKLLSISQEEAHACAKELLQDCMSVKDVNCVARKVVCC